MIDMIAKRLASWKCKHILFGGRLILLNSVLSNIPTYMFSLYKAPKKVLSVTPEEYSNSKVNHKKENNTVIPQYKVLHFLV
ncbi:hypothetical protein Lal_00012004 [Lupinus albus]|nr:hypothetical protein Lal_00012004 [Lupinus albus]